MTNRGVVVTLRDIKPSVILLQPPSLGNTVCEWKWMRVDESGRKMDDFNWKKVYMANVGIEPKTFALLVRRSNQLS